MTSHGRYRLVLLIVLLIVTVAGPAMAATCVVGPAEIYTTIQSAIDDATCSTVQVLPGRYTEALTITRTVAVVGGGLRSTLLEAPAVATDPAAIIHVSGADTSVRLRFLTMDGGETHRFGVKVDGGAYAFITDTRIRAPFRTGPFIPIQVGDVAAGESGRADIWNNRPEYYEPVAIVVEGAGSAAVIQNNTVDAGVARSAPALPVSGIRVSDGATATIRKNRVSDHGYEPPRADAVGIHVRDAASGLSIAYNAMDRNDVGILIENTDAVDVRVNRLYTGPVAALAVDGSAGSTFYYNRVLGAGVGLDLAGLTSSLVSKNQVRNTTGAGVALTSSTGNTLSTNVSFTNGTYPFQDDSHGDGTAGTANTYTLNRCLRTAVSQPPGLCR
jgi:parallel beta-helix repeat protein